MIQTELSTPIAPITVETPKTFNPEMAGFMERYFALFFDSLFIFIIQVVLALSMDSESAAYYILATGIGFIYIFSTMMVFGQTFGKMIMKIKIVRSDDLGKLSFGTVFIREVVGKILSQLVLHLGYTWYFMSPTRQTWHDSMAKTYAVKLDGQGNIKEALSFPYPKKPFLAFIFPILMLILVVIFIASAILLAAINPKALMEEAEQQSGLQKSQTQTTYFNTKTFETDVLGQLNEIRTLKGITALEYNQKNCAYALRRLDSVAERQSYDEGKGLMEDMGDAQIANVYFKDYPTVYESYTNIAGVNNPNPKEIASNYANMENSLVLDEKFTQGCVKTDREGVFVIISGN